MNLLTYINLFYVSWILFFFFYFFVQNITLAGHLGEAASEAAMGVAGWKGMGVQRPITNGRPMYTRGGHGESFSKFSNQQQQQQQNISKS